jgi:hypothetical protein
MLGCGQRVSAKGKEKQMTNVTNPCEAVTPALSPAGQGLRPTIEHVAGAIGAALQRHEPFYHLQLANVFPADIYASMLEAMPANDFYRRMSGRIKSTRTADGGGTRTKMDLFPEFIRHLPQEKKAIWEVVGQALCSKEVREAFRYKLAPCLEQRFGPNWSKVGMYPIPILTRDVPGYRIGIHPDTHWKGMTIQLYLPKDNSIKHVGTVFHKRTGEESYERALQMSFSPNTGYAFVVGEATYHSVDLVGPEVKTRDSILLTYFVDKTLLQVLRNRGKRIGNLIRNEFRHMGW